MRRALLYIFLIISLLNKAQEPVVPQVDPSLTFTENKGQWDSNIKYRSKFSGGTLYMEAKGMTYAFFDKKARKSFHLGGIGETKDPRIKAHCIKVEFLGCNQNFKTEHSDEGVFYENFYQGSDRTKWKGHVKNYHKIWYRNIYNNIDYEAITTIKGIKYNFYVKPGGNSEAIKLKYSGANKIKLINNELMIITSIDSIVEKKPYAYQNINGKIVEVPCKYRLKDNTVSFDFPKGYDPKYELVIDPILVFAAQSGSLADNFGMTATYDNAGNLYSGGTVFDNGYPTSAGAYDITFSGPPAFGNTDVVVTKYNATGTTLLFSTYLGGSGSEIVTSLIVDASNNLFLYGATGSSNFPTTAGAYDNSFNGGNYLFFMFNGTEFVNGTDIFVSKFNATGTNLLGSTYVGGSDNDGVNYTNALITYTVSYTGTVTPGGPTSTAACVATGGVFTLNEHKADSLQFNYGDQYRGEIQLDKLGNVYIASSTRSSNFPIVGGFDNTLGGKQDAAVLKFNPNLTNIVWSSFLGGTDNDAGYALVVTDSLFTYVTGGTCSTNFPATAGCYNTSYNGGKADGYIVKINPAGNAILKGTYLGTSDYDQSYCIQKDKQNRIYVYGQSAGSMTVTPGVYSVPNAHQFITRFDGQLANVNMGTVFGSGLPRIDISPSAFSVDNCGNIYTSGWGGHLIYGPALLNMPITPGAYQTATANGFDFYLMVLSANATSLLYGTYFGGACSPEHVDGGTSRFDPRGIIYQSVCAGCQNNEDFPVTPGAWPNTPGNHNKSSNCNNGVFKFDFQIKITNVNITTNTITGCQPLTVNFSNSTYAGGTFTWNFGGGNTNTTNINPSYTFTNAGTYTVTLVVRDTTSCNQIDSTLTYITVYPSVTVAATASQVPCSDTLQYNGSAVTSGTLNTFQWTFQPGGSISTSTITSPINSYTSSGTYTAQLLATNNYGCRDSLVVSVNINTLVPTVTSNTICEGASGGLTAGGGTSYSWSPATGLSNTTIANPVANPTVTTNYTVAITNTLTGCSRTLTTIVVVNPKPTANFTFTTNPCGGGVNFTDNSASGITQWNWNFGNSQTSTSQNPYQFYNPGGTFSVSLISGNAFNCYDTIVKVVTVGTPPPVSVSSTQTICAGGFVYLNATGGFAYQWTPTVSLINPNSFNPIATPSVTTQYSVVVSTLNSLGDTCKFMLTTSVVVTQASAFPISASASPSVLILGESTVLTVSATPGANATWYPIGSTTPINGYTVNATPEHSTTYTVVIQRGPCSDTAVVFVEVIEDGCFDTDVFVPNTFTPNGDGFNDVMYARGHKLAEIYFAIYNRWGEMVFETKDIKVGWDGNYKGRPADVGVFGYYVKIKCYNGKETFKKGNITLIR